MQLFTRIYSLENYTEIVLSHWPPLGTFVLLSHGVKLLLNVCVKEFISFVCSLHAAYGGH